MELFGGAPIRSLLPFDGEALYYGPVLSPHSARSYFCTLLDSIAWRNDEVYIFGRHYVTKREVAWYGDEAYSYAYSNSTKKALTWTPELLKLKIIVEQLAESPFNSCLLNLYHNGNEGMGWHSDDETCLGSNTTIASLSLGAERKFAFRHKSTKHPVSVFLEHGSLLVMAGSTQHNWAHALPKSCKVSSPRINLTFRTILES